MSHRKNDQSKHSDVNMFFNKNSIALKKALKITSIYFLFGCLWIVLSDSITPILFSSIPNILIASIYKGLFYVFITALLIFGLVYPSLRNVLVAQQKLSESESVLRTMFEQAPVGVALGSGGDCIISGCIGNEVMNVQFEKIIGWTRQELSNVGWKDIVHPDDLPLVMELSKKINSEKFSGFELEIRCIRPDDSIVWVHLVVAPLSVSETLNKYSHICLIKDITDSKKIEKALCESERSKSVLLSNIPGMAYRCKSDFNWTMEFVSEGSFELTGYKPDGLIDNKDISFNDLILPEYRNIFWENIENVSVENYSYEYEYEILTASGKKKWVLDIGQNIYNDDKEIVALEGIIIDITERKNIEQRLKYNGEHDIWTGLHNRQYLKNILNADAKAKAIADDKRAVIGIDLSSINALSLTYGFQYGQTLIKRLADALSTHCDQQHSLFYTYTNRFVFYMHRYEDNEDILSFCTKIIITLEAILTIERIGGSIGIVEINDKNFGDSEQILKNLLIASERALINTEQEFPVCFFDEQMETQILREEEIKNELANITVNVNNKNLYVNFQPIVDLKSGGICGFEALARLQTEKLGAVSPYEFIPLAEKTKLIIPIGQIIIRQSLSFLSKLNKRGFDDINIAINVSAIQLLRHDFNVKLFDAIKDAGVNPSSITLEITESVFSDRYNEINAMLGEIQEMGIKIAIDDFGTGYSSLARERELNVNCLKIDKYFMDKLMEDDIENAISGDIISMAHRLGHCVVAEGIEHELQKQYLVEHDCDMMQGYLVSRPIDEQAAIKLLNEFVS